MSESRPPKPGFAPPHGGAPSQSHPGAPAAGTALPQSRPDSASSPPAKAPAAAAGRGAAGERPNAVWNWIKAASKTALDSTSILLKKLEAPDLKMENPEDEEVRGLPDSKDKGGGYDPYNQPIKPRAPGKPPRKP
jgi:hypothetical protein